MVIMWQSSVLSMDVKPYNNLPGTKKEQVVRMFDGISARYDLLNRVLSLGIDRIWRKKAMACLKPLQPRTILDIATGTGDFALEALALQPEKIIGVDISAGMLSIGKEKISKRNLSDKIEMVLADSENLPFANNMFDAVTVGFGVRNFENLEQGLSEIRRVLRPGGMVVILEFSQPRPGLWSALYLFYFKHILPRIGRWVSRDSSAYSYLPASVEAFPSGNAFVQILNKVGFNRVTCKPLTFGISSVYTACK
jgi:demethylmenaquinone methyltransferase/2-methoxy-6-polyprenyl-1,4-benzoquinol methylase